MAEDKIVIDVVTLDSVQCAACGYMMESIAALPDDVQDMIEYRDWSIKNKDGIGTFMELGVKGFQFDKIQANLEKAGAGKSTRSDSKMQ